MLLCNLSFLYVPEKGWALSANYAEERAAAGAVAEPETACHRTHRQGDPGQLGGALVLYG
jgi:hypothetical protein